MEELERRVIVNTLIEVNSCGSCAGGICISVCVSVCVLCVCQACLYICVWCVPDVCTRVCVCCVYFKRVFNNQRGIVWRFIYLFILLSLFHSFRWVVDVWMRRTLWSMSVGGKRKKVGKGVEDDAAAGSAAAGPSSSCEAALDHTLHIHHTHTARERERAIGKLECFYRLRNCFIAENA